MEAEDRCTWRHGYTFPLWASILAALLSAYLATALAFSILLFTGQFGDPAYWAWFAMIGSIPYLIFAMGTGAGAILLTAVLRPLAAGSRSRAFIGGVTYALVAAVPGGFAFVRYSQDPDGLTAEVIYAALVFGLIAGLMPTWVVFSTSGYSAEPR